MNDRSHFQRNCCKSTMSWQKLAFFVLVSAVPRVAHAREPVIETRSEPIVDEINIDGATIVGGGIDQRLFKQFFVKRRKEHLNIVKNIRQINDYEKRYRLVRILAENSLDIIETSRDKIRGIKFVPEDSEVLKNSTIRHALSTILENCALFGDVILQLPDITRRVIKSEERWNATLQWGLSFVNETRHLLDEPTIEMFDFARQELRIVPRRANYANPYWPSAGSKEDGTTKERDGRKKRAEKSRKKKGPRMVHIDL